jgi:3-phenylpropionate/trans-cinnamate dioxygenase ferredoxin subunit
MRRREVALAADLPLGQLRRVMVDGIAICLVRVSDGKVYGVSDICTHEGQSLSDGELWGMEIECPRHVSRFDVRTGEVTGPPALVSVQTFTVEDEDGKIYVDV